MKINWHRITESIIPVILLLSLIVFILMYVEYRSSQNSERTHYIQISANMELEISVEEANSIVEDDYSDDPRIVQANELVKQNRYKEAENIYFKVLAKEPSAQIYNWLGTLYLKQKKYSKAVVSLSSSIDTNPRYYRAYYNRALAYNELKEFQKAIKDYNKVLKIVNTHVKAHLNIGLLYYKQKEYQKAIDIFKKSVTLSSGDKKVKAYYLLANSYTNIEPADRRKAAQAYTEAIRLNPRHIPSRLGLINIEYADNKDGFEKKIEALKELLKLENENISIYRALSDVYMKLSNEKLALQNLEQALLNKPNNISLQFETIDLLIRLKKYQEAMVILDNILRLRPKSIKAQLLLGELFYKQGEYRSSLDMYNKVLTTKKNGTYELWNKIGILHAKTKKYDEAKKAYNKALKLRSDYPQAYYNLGLLYLKKDDFKNAEIFFNKAIAFRDDYKQAYIKLAFIYEKQNKLTQELKTLEKIVKIDPESISNQLDLAIMYSRNNQYLKAQKIYEDVLNKDSSYYSAWLNLGLAFYKQKSYEDSVEALKKAVELEDSEKANRLLARSLLSLKKYDESIKILRKVLGKNPSSIKTRLAYARTYYRAKKRNTALREYKKVLKLDPDNKVAIKMIEKIQTKRRNRNARK